MTDLAAFDPALFGTWPDMPAMADHRLETKSAEPPREDLRLLLNDMTREMREQFDYFRKLRGAAEALGAVAGDEAAGKLARADVKAATDAMSLIVRTLEKVDGLQRQLVRDRELEAERHAQTPAYEDARARFLVQIEARAHEIALALFDEWKRGASGAVAAECDGGEGGTGPRREAPAGEGDARDGGRARPACGPPPAGDGGDRPRPWRSLPADHG